MRLTLKDARATVAVALAAVLYVLWATGVVMTSTSTRVLGAVVFALGWVACTSATAEMKAIYGPKAEDRPPMLYVVGASIVGGIALVAGVMTLATGSEAMLATLVATMVVLWGVATIRHMMARHTVDMHEGVHAPAHA